MEKIRLSSSLNIESLNQSQINGLVIEILQQPKEMRTKNSYLILQKCMQNISFFQKLIETQGLNAVQKCIRKLKFEFFGVGQIIFYQGSVGDKFYIILKGLIQVYIKKPSDQQKKVTKLQLKKQLQYLPNIDPDQILVNTLKVGDSFGELALINNSKRNATIFTKEETILAVLEKANFQEILSDLSKEKHQKKIALLEKINVFHQISHLNAFVYACKEREFTVRSYVYREGQHQNSYMYIIKEGQFILTKNLIPIFEIGPGELVDIFPYNAFHKLGWSTNYNMMSNKLNSSICLSLTKCVAILNNPTILDTLKSNAFSRMDMYHRIFEKQSKVRQFTKYIDSRNYNSLSLIECQQVEAKQRVYDKLNSRSTSNINFEEQSLLQSGNKQTQIQEILSRGQLAGTNNLELENQSTYYVKCGVKNRGIMRWPVKARLFLEGEIKKKINASVQEIRNVNEKDPIKHLLGVIYSRRMKMKNGSQQRYTSQRIRYSSFYEG